MKQQPNEFTIIAKYNQKMYNKKLVLDRKYAKMINLRKEKLEFKKSKEIERFEKRRKKAMETELHNLTHKRQRKQPKDQTVSKVKAKALTEIQKYTKLSRAVLTDNWIVIQVMDKMEQVPLDSKVNGWHVYSQRNYPNLAFDIKNIRPITSWWNRKQLDTTGERIVNLPIKIQKYLIKRSNEPKKKQIRNRAFYEWIIEQYKALNRVEEIRLWIKK